MKIKQCSICGNDFIGSCSPECTIQSWKNNCNNSRKRKKTLKRSTKMV